MNGVVPQEAFITDMQDYFKYVKRRYSEDAKGGRPDIILMAYFCKTRTRCTVCSGLMKLPKELSIGDMSFKKRMISCMYVFAVLIPPDSFQGEEHST